MHILFIAYNFPPSSSSGAFRPLYFARHLLESGHGITVLTVKPEYYLPDQPQDHALLSEEDQQMSIVRTPVLRPRERLVWFKNLFRSKKSNSPAADRTKPSGQKKRASKLQSLKDTVTDLLATPDPQIGWLPFAVFKGKKVIKQNQVDIILATASPWTSLLIGVFLKALSKKPLVMDFRDPWVANPGFFRRGRVGRWIDTKLERFVIRRVDTIVANTENLRRDFLQRYQFLSPEQVHTVPNGFEAYEGRDRIPESSSMLTITHTGALYFSRNPEQLLQAVKNCIQKGSIDPQKIRLQFVGGISTKSEQLQGLISSPELEPVLQIVPRVPYAQALEYMQSSTVLLVVQPGFPLQIPRKVYDYMAMRKPMLCLAEEQSATWNLVQENGLGFVCQNTSQDIEPLLEHMYQSWQKGTLVSLNNGQCDQYLNKNLTSRLQDVFASLQAQSVR